MSAPSSSVFPQWAVQSSIVKEYQRALAGLGIEDVGNVHLYLDRITYLLWKALGEDLVEIARVAAVLGGGSKINTESFFSMEIREGDKGKDPIGGVIAEIERRASVARGREREKMLNVELRQSRNDCRVQFMTKENKEINKEGIDGGETTRTQVTINAIPSPLPGASTPVLQPSASVATINKQQLPLGTSKGAVKTSLAKSIQRIDPQSRASTPQQMPVLTAAPSKANITPSLISNKSTDSLHPPKPPTMMKHPNASDKENLHPQPSKPMLSLPRMSSPARSQAPEKSSPPSPIPEPRLKNILLQCPSSPLSSTSSMSSLPTPHHNANLLTDSIINPPQQITKPALQPGKPQLSKQTAHYRYDQFALTLPSTPCSLALTSPSRALLALENGQTLLLDLATQTPKVLTPTSFFTRIFFLI